MAKSAKNTKATGLKPRPMPRDEGRPDGAPDAYVAGSPNGDRHASVNLLAGTRADDASPEAIEKRREAQRQYLDERRVTHTQILQDAVNVKRAMYVLLAMPNNQADQTVVALEEDEAEAMREALQGILKARGEG